jgi:hypothetical protein
VASGYYNDFYFGFETQVLADSEAEMCFDWNENTSFRNWDDEFIFYAVPDSIIPWGGYCGSGMGFFYHVNSGLCVAGAATSDSYPAFANGRYQLEECSVCSNEEDVPTAAQLFCYEGSGCMLFQGDAPRYPHGYFAYGANLPSYDYEGGSCDLAFLGLLEGYCIEWPANLIEGP